MLEKKYFTIGEASKLCQVKPHVLRFWEQEFPQLQPAKRLGNRRYYAKEMIEMAQTIRRLLYEEGFTISGAKQQLELTDSFMEVKKADPALKKMLQNTIQEIDEILTAFSV